VKRKRRPGEGAARWSRPCDRALARFVRSNQASPLKSCVLRHEAVAAKRRQRLLMLALGALREAREIYPAPALDGASVAILNEHLRVRLAERDRAAELRAVQTEARSR
jgi:hypothetical protein